jgi:hypothetical protein
LPSKILLKTYAIPIVLRAPADLWRTTQRHDPLVGEDLHKTRTRDRVVAALRFTFPGRAVQRFAVQRCNGLFDGGFAGDRSR